MPNDITFKLAEKREITAIPNLLAELEEMRHESRARLFFRGHGRIGDLLVPSIGRPRSFGGAHLPKFTFEQERLLLHRFRRFAYTHLGRVISEWEALLLARHHGLPTRLLDWSMSPLAALFFACSEEPDKDGCLWAFARFTEDKSRRTKDLDVIEAMIKGKTPLVHFLTRQAPRPPKVTNDYVRLVYPVSNTPRIIVQGGAFTLHSNPTLPLNEYAGVGFKPGKLDVRQLVRWPITAQNKHRFLVFLEICGISRRSLFPDLDGLCTSLWQTETLFEGKPPPNR
ncbi:MAG: FRG domain-containing protein [Verrucomicrobia bacterium]|nr:FRG domain-containing protein [Verrucomicrobiota bacterium]